MSGFNLIGSDAVVRETAVIETLPSQPNVPGTIAISADALPAGSVTWWNMVDNIGSYPSFVNIRTADTGHVNFQGRGPLRLDVYGSRNRVGRTECVIQGSGQIALPGVPAGKTPSVAWWCPVDNVPALNSFVSIRTFVLNDGMTLVTFNGTGPLRLDIYTAFDLSIARAEVVIQGNGRQEFQTAPVGATAVDAWCCPIHNIPALQSFVSIRTFVEGNKTVVEHNGLGPLRLEVYTAFA